MRRRSTFISKIGTDYDPSRFEIDDRRLSFTGLQGAREERVTFGLETLPAELVNVLKQCHELHIRWVSESVYLKSSPYLSSLTSGLHVYYTPIKGEYAQTEQLCRFLQATFSEQLRCITPEQSFSRPDILSSRFAAAASLQYYSLLPSLRQLIAKLLQQYCAEADITCHHGTALLEYVSYLDFDYDSIGHALTVTAYWAQSPTNTSKQSRTQNHWSMILDESPNDKNEFGFLRSINSTAELSEIKMEGFLIMVGEDAAPKPTMFFFPSRHHGPSEQQARQQGYMVTFDEPTGLHPTMRISLPSSLPSPMSLKEPEKTSSDNTCGLHAYLTLPSALFIDEYAFPTADLDALFTEAHNIRLLRSLSGERDLEAPDYVIRKWGSALLLELATPEGDASSSSSTWDVTVPLHLRYLEPASGGERTIRVPWPIIFWACTTEEGTKFTVNPFDRVNLGYDGLFGSRTMFYHLDPQPKSDGSLVEPLTVPVLDNDVLSYGLAETVTLLLVLGGFVWLAGNVVREILWETNWWSKSHANIKEKKAD